MNENDFQSTIGLGFDNLCVGNDDVKILNNVSGYVIKGGVTAVLGPSAAGKSFLLQTLSGRITEFPIKGTVFMNGQVVDPSSRSNPGKLIHSFFFLLFHLLILRFCWMTVTLTFPLTFPLPTFFSSGLCSARRFSDW